MTDMMIVLRSLRARLLASSVTIAMVAVAVALLLVLLSLRTAANNAFRKGTGNAHLLVSADASPLVAVLNGLFYANAPANPIPWAKLNELKSGFPWQWAIATQLGDSYRGNPVMATEAGFLSDFQPVNGRPFEYQFGGCFKDSFEVVVGSECASEHDLKVGQSIAFSHSLGASHEGGHEHTDHPYKVVGVLKPTGSLHDRALFTNLESSWIIHAEERHEREEANSEGEHDHDHDQDHDHDEGGHEHISAEQLTDGDKLVTGLLLRLPTRPGTDASASIAAQFDRLRRDTSITVAQPAQQIGRLMAIVGDIDWIFLAMGVVVLVSSATSIMLAMISSMELRRRQVAILRVLGASAWRVFALAVTESTMIGVLGSCIGLALALLAMDIAGSLLTARIGVLINDPFDLRSASLVVLGALALSALAGVIPAVKAYRTPVAHHLRPIA